MLSKIPFCVKETPLLTGEKFCATMGKTDERGAEMNRAEMISYTAPEWRDLPDLDLYMDQVIGVMEKHLARLFGEDVAITPTMINNYVKNRFLPPPVNKKYNRRHLARLFQICVLKSFMQLSDADALLNRTWDGLEPEDAHHRFCLALNRAVQAVFAGKTGMRPDPEPQELALDSALVAAACILYARRCFLEDAPEKKA